MISEMFLKQHEVPQPRNNTTEKKGREMIQHHKF